MSQNLAKAKELRIERARLADEARKIVETVNKRDGKWTPEETASFDKMHAEIEAKRSAAVAIEEAADKEQRQIELDAELLRSQPTLAGKSDRTGDGSAADKAAEYAEKRATAFRAYAVAGPQVLTQEERQILGMTSVTREDIVDGKKVDPRIAGAIGQGGIRYRLRPMSALKRTWNEEGRRFELRANEPQSHTNGFGGYTMPNEPMTALEDAMLHVGGVRNSRATVLRTSTGNNLPIPSANDTANEGAILNENSQETGALPLAFTQTVLGAYKYSSDWVLASFEFLQDTSIDAETYIAKKLGERIGRITNRHATKGSNSSQPYGVQWAATLGKTAASATALAYEEVIDLQHSVDPDYRANAEFMFSDGTLAVIKKLEDSYGRPLWLPSIALREPDRILGHAYVINQHMDTVAAGKHSMLFGDFSKYYLREVMDVTVIRAVERYVDYAQVGFIAFARFDSDLVDAGTHPITYLRHPAS